MNQTEAHTEAASQEHGSLIKTPKQLIVTVVLSFIIPVVIIIMLVKLVVTSSPLGAGSNALSPEAIASRIKPVAGFSLVDVNAPKEMKTGQQVYESTCTACHAAGVAGAPKSGDAAAWAPLIQSGLPAMLKIALEGKGAMPAKGGNPSLSDFEIERAVVYMANQSGGNLPEPTEGGGEAAADATPAAEAAPAETAPAEAAAPTAPAPASEQPAATPGEAAPASPSFQTEGDNGAQVNSGA